MGDALPSADAAARLRTPNAAELRGQAAFHLEGAYNTVIAPAARAGHTSAILAFDPEQANDAAWLASAAGYSVTVFKWRGQPTGRIELTWPERPSAPPPEGRPVQPRLSPIWEADDPDYTPWRRFQRWLGLTTPA